MTSKAQDAASGEEMIATGAAHATAPDAAATAEVAEDIAAQLAKVETEVNQLKDAWLRAKAETDNVRKVAQADVAKAHKYAIERFAEDLLPVKDALEQTLSAGEVSLDTLKAMAVCEKEFTAKPVRWVAIVSGSHPRDELRAFVAESGIHSRIEASRMQAAGYDAVLVGEALVRSPDPSSLIREIAG